MTSGSTPEQRVSRNFTFRVQGEDSPRDKKKRKRRLDSDEGKEEGVGRRVDILEY